MFPTPDLDRLFFPGRAFHSIFKGPPWHLARPRAAPRLEEGKDAPERTRRNTWPHLFKETLIKELTWRMDEADCDSPAMDNPVSARW